MEISRDGPSRRPPEIMAQSSRLAEEIHTHRKPSSTSFHPVFLPLTWFEKEEGNGAEEETRRRGKQWARVVLTLQSTTFFSSPFPVLLRSSCSNQAHKNNSMQNTALQPVRMSSIQTAAFQGFGQEIISIPPGDARNGI